MSYVCTLDETALRKAYDELNEKPEWRMRDIEALRQLCQKTPGLNACLDDAFLVRFLRARKFEYDGALELLLNYYRQRAQYPVVFDNFSPSSVKMIIETGLVCMLAKRDAIGRQLIVLRPGKWNPSDCSFLEMVKCIAVCMEQLIVDESLQVHGFVYIVDSSDFGWLQLRAFYPADVRSAFRILQDAFPSRTKEIHFIHEPRAFGVAFSIMSPLFKEKIRQRIHFHGSSVESLHASISPDLLPDDPAFKGTGPPLRNESFIDSLMENEAEFVRLAQFGVEATRVSPDRLSDNSDAASSDGFEDAVSQFEDALGGDGNGSSSTSPAAAPDGGVDAKSALAMPSLADIQKRMSECTSWIPSSTSSYRRWFNVFGVRPNAEVTAESASQVQTSSASEANEPESPISDNSANEPQAS